MINVLRRDLREGYDISTLIKGGWQLSGDHGLVDSLQAVQDMIHFVHAGVTTFDCADIYSGVEEMIGEFRIELIRQCGAEAAKSIKIHTKCVPDRDSLAVLKFEHIEAVIDRSLSRLGQDRLDLVQFHWWDYSIDSHIDAIGYLARLRDKGKINLIGVTNFDYDHLAALCAVCDIASAQVQYSLLDRRAEGQFARLAKLNNVNLISYGTLAGGFLSDNWLGRPDPGFEFENRSLVKYRLIIDEFGGWDLYQNLLTALRTIADRHGTNIATIALRTSLESDDVAAVIVGARYADRLQDTLQAFNLQLSEEDQRSLDLVLQNRKGPHGEVYELERDVNGRHGKIMKYNLNKGDQKLFSDLEPHEVDA